MSDANAVTDLVQRHRSEVKIAGADIPDSDHIGFSAVETDKAGRQGRVDKIKERLRQNTGCAINRVEAEPNIHVGGVGNLGKLDIGDRLPGIERISGSGQEGTADGTIEIERLPSEVAGRGAPGDGTADSPKRRAAPFYGIGVEIKRAAGDDLGIPSVIAMDVILSAVRVIKNVIGLAHGHETPKRQRKG